MDESGLSAVGVGQAVDASAQCGYPQAALAVFLDVVDAVVAQRVGFFGIMLELLDAEPAFVRLVQAEKPVGFASHPEGSRAALHDAVDASCKACVLPVQSAVVAQVA